MGLRNVFKNMKQRFRRKNERQGEKTTTKTPAQPIRNLQEKSSPINEQFTASRNNEPEIISQKSHPDSVETKSQTLIIEGKFVEVKYKEPRPTVEPEKYKSVLHKLVSQLMKAGADVAQVIVDSSVEATEKITYYNRVGHIIREEVIPVIAVKAAYDEAQRTIESMKEQGFDEEIISGLQEKLAQRLEDKQQDSNQKTK